MKVWINADDFGWNRTCTEAILESFEKGYITSTTACVNGEYFSKAVEQIKSKGFENAVGIHFNLTEGIPLTRNIQKYDCICDNGKFNQKLDRFRPLSQKLKDAIYEELTEQATQFKRSGLSIHHADSHHHIHNAPNIFPIFMRVVKEQKIPAVRLFRNVGYILFYKKLLKAMYNHKIETLGLAYTTLMGAYEDYCFQLEKSDFTFEMMVHPDLNASKIIDRNPDATYDYPYGVLMSDIIDEIEHRGDVIISL